MPQPPADWVPFDDRAPAEDAAQGFVYRSEGFAEDLPAAGTAGRPPGRADRWGFRALLAAGRGRATADAVRFPDT